MGISQILLPTLGDTITSATLTKWLVSEGDLVDVGQTIAIVSTDKTDVDVQAPSTGRIIEFLCGEGTTIPVGRTIATIDHDVTTSVTRPNLDAWEMKLLHQLFEKTMTLTKAEREQAHRLEVWGLLTKVGPWTSPHAENIPVSITPAGRVLVLLKSQNS